MAVLSEDYCEILAVLTDSDHGLRTGQVVAELGISTPIGPKRRRCVGNGGVRGAGLVGPTALAGCSHDRMMLV